MEVKKNEEVEKIEVKKNGYKTLLKEKNYMLQTIAAIISRFGDGLDTVAFSFLILEITGSGFLVAILYGVNGIPNLIFGMISGVVCKYVTDKKIMAICDFGRFACVGLIAVLYLNGNLEVWHLFVITFLSSSFESFRAPASMSIIPKIIPMEKMEHAMAFSSTGTKIAELVGLAMATVVIGFIGLAGAILIDAATFLICGILILGIKLKDKLVQNDKLTVKKYLIDLKEGFSYIKNDGLILNVVILCAVINGLFAPLTALQAPFVKEVLNLGAGGVAMIGIGILTGMAATSMFAPIIKEKLGNKGMFILGGMVMGIAYSTLSLLGNLPSNYTYTGLAVNAFVFGVGILLCNFPLQMIMMKKVPQEYLGRVAATFNAVALCAVPISSFTVGIFMKFITIEMLFMAMGIIIVLLFIIQNFSKVTKRYNEV